MYSPLMTSPSTSPNTQADLYKITFTLSVQSFTNYLLKDVVTVHILAAIYYNCPGQM